MWGDRRILAVIPARGGSKGVPFKNIQFLNGIPLIGHTGNVIRQLSYVDKAIVSTDHPKIAQVAVEFGIEAPFVRPENISGDRIGDWEVLVHALAESEKINDAKYDVVLMLQPTCPMRKPEHVTETLKKLIDENLDSVWTVTETDSKHHPLKQFVVSSEGALSYYDERGKAIIARQQLTPVYHRNGAAYAITRDCLLEQKTILGKRAGAVIVTDSLVNIDTMADFELAQWQMSREGKSHGG